MLNQEQAPGRQVIRLASLRLHLSESSQGNQLLLSLRSSCTAELWGTVSGSCPTSSGSQRCPFCTRPGLQLILRGPTMPWEGSQLWPSHLGVQRQCLGQSMGPVKHCGSPSLSPPPRHCFLFGLPERAQTACKARLPVLVDHEHLLLLKHPSCGTSASFYCV